jgi:ABC-type phosphate transport system substrate-binding protein
MGILDAVKNSYELQVNKDVYNKVVSLTNVIFDKNKSDAEVRTAIKKFLYKDNKKYILKRLGEN